MSVTVWEQEGPAVTRLNHANSASTPPDVPKADTAKMSRYLGLFWGSIWVVWLITPLVQAWRAGSVVGVAAIVSFASLYLWHFYLRAWVFADHPSVTMPARSVSSRQAAARYALMLALAAAAAVTIGQNGAACFVFTGIASMWTFPVRVAVLIAAVTGGAYSWAWSAVAGWRADYGSLIGLCFGVLACMAGRLSAQRQRALEASRTENAHLIVQEERNRMARDLHDILGHSLTVITMKAELAGRLVDLDPQKAKAQIAELEQLSRSALADVRTTVSGYREMSLSGEIARARSALADAGIRADMPGSVDAVSPDLRELFAWAVREATTNVIRHSGASECIVTLEPTRLVIHDDGRGSNTAATDGNGLAGLRERAAAVGAVATIETADGFTLTVGVPATKES